MASPNCAPRPLDSPVELVVVHNISLPPGEFGGPHIEELFTNRLDPQAHPYFAEIAELTVSAHFLIRRSGDVFSLSLRRKMPGMPDYPLGASGKSATILVLGLNLRALTPMSTPMPSTVR